MTPDPGTGRSKQRIRASWQRELIAHLDRHKCYPGTRAEKSAAILIDLVLDRTGRVLSATIRKSSQDSAFDQAALDMVRRPDPVPAPPALVADDGLAFVLRVDLNARDAERRQRRGAAASGNPKPAEHFFLLKPLEEPMGRGTTRKTTRKATKTRKAKSAKAKTAKVKSTAAKTAKAKTAKARTAKAKTAKTTKARSAKAKTTRARPANTRTAKAKTSTAKSLAAKTGAAIAGAAAAGAVKVLVNALAPNPAPAKPGMDETRVDRTRTPTPSATKASEPKPRVAKPRRLVTNGTGPSGSSDFDDQSLGHDEIRAHGERRGVPGETIRTQGVVESFELMDPVKRAAYMRAGSGKKH